MYELNSFITLLSFQQYYCIQSSWATNHYPPAKNENPIRDASDQHSKGHGGSKTKYRAQLNQGESLSVWGNEPKTTRVETYKKFWKTHGESLGKWSTNGGVFHICVYICIYICIYIWLFSVAIENHHAMNRSASFCNIYEWVIFHMKFRNVYSSHLETQLAHRCRKLCFQDVSLLNDALEISIYLQVYNFSKKKSGACDIYIYIYICMVIIYIWLL